MDVRCNEHGAPSAEVGGRVLTPHGHGTFGVTATLRIQYPAGVVVVAISS